MFALEVSFKDGTSPPTLLFVRRPQAIIGSSNFANIVLDDMKSLNFQLRITRNVGRSFTTAILPLPGIDAGPIPLGLEGVFDKHVQFDLGPVKLEITPIDTDLILKEGEAPDKAGVRILRLATSSESARFPALVTGSPAMVISFNPETPIVIGRSRPCALRIESADISSRHARVGFDGDNFWIEDLGSTNGTFVRGVRVAGKTKVASGETIMLARECAVVGISSQLELDRLLKGEVEEPESHIVKIATTQSTYPVLLSLSEVAKPNRLALVHGSTLSLGREPSSDMWLGAPHVSRKHCLVFLADDGLVKITDQSSNGTEHDSGRIERGQSLTSLDEPRVLNFGEGITVALCFSEEQEWQFRRAQGAVASFGVLPSEKSEYDGASAQDDIKISDVSKLLGRRGRRATAHHLQSLYGSGGKSVQFWFGLLVVALLIVLAVGAGLIGAILF